jgi:sigma-B regulation protein RsbU (phosphoserine phosphatase)
MGVVPGAKYHQGAVSISPGDLLVLYSDGVTEAPNALEEQFGEERLIAVIRGSSPQASAAWIRNEILRQVRLFIGETEVQDDLTLVVVRFRAA